MILGLIISHSLQSCSPVKTANIGDFKQGKPSSTLLDAAINSTYLINTVSYYTQYFLPEDKIWSREDLSRVNFSKFAKDQKVITRPSSGTGIMVSRQNEKVVFLTSAHLFDLPDTIFISMNKNDSSNLSSVLIRSKFEIFLPDVVLNKDLKVVAIDHEKDLSLLLGEADIANVKLKVFPFKLGDPTRLDWGNEVYIFGYPQGFHMMTRGLVSKPFKYRPNDFAVDAMFNRGMSGAPILYYDNNENDFQLMGLGRSVSAETYSILSPEEQIENEAAQLKIKYSGELYTDEITIVNQGVSFSVSATAVKQFLDKNRELVILSPLIEKYPVKP